MHSACMPMAATGPQRCAAPALTTAANGRACWPQALVLLEYLSEWLVVYSAVTVPGHRSTAGVPAFKQVTSWAALLLDSFWTALVFSSHGALPCSVPHGPPAGLQLVRGSVLALGWQAARLHMQSNAKLLLPRRKAAHPDAGGASASASEADVQTVLP